MSRLPVAIVGAFIVGTILACGEAPAPPGEAAFELGTGSWRFEPLEDGQEVELVRGAQGGWHVWVSLRMRGIDVERPPIELTLQPADESRPADQLQLQLLFEPEDDQGWRKLIAYQGIVEDPACVVGELLRVRAVMAMGDGTVMTAEHDVRVTGGAYPPPACE